jgi:hypothetical protein
VTSDAQWLPPRNRPANESAGYLGFYCRVHLPAVFDLVDWDGSDPLVWHYWKAQTRTYRIFEEKPSGQQLHDSQNRTLRWFVWRFHIGVYVIHDAQRLTVPSFPIEIAQLGAYPRDDRKCSFERIHFDKWMVDGLVSLESIEDVEDQHLIDEAQLDADWARFEAWRTENADLLGEPF